MKLLLASRNRDKIEEIRSILEGLDFQLLDADDIPDLPEVEEDGSTLKENAIKKALVCARFSGLLTVADDTGLFVEALQGKPGIYAARYAGVNCTYADNRKKLLSELLCEQNRTAEFRTVVALAIPEGIIATSEGVVRGTISEQESGINGFGYDPIFIVTSMGKTYAELNDEEKNRISHRSIALKNMRSHLSDLLEHKGV